MSECLRPHSLPSEQEKLAKENGIEMYESAGTGLKVENAKVDVSVVSKTPTSNGYTVVVDMSTDLRQVPEDGVTITIGNEKRDYLDTTVVYRHELQLEPDAGATGGYRVVSDNTILDGDGSRQPELVSNPNGSASTSAYDAVATRVYAARHHRKAMPIRWGSTG